MTEEQKRWILKHDYIYTIQKMTEKIGVSGKEIYDWYSSIVDSGEYKILKKPNLRGQWRRLKNERERDIEEKSRESEGNDNNGSDVVSANDSGRLDIFTTMWSNPSSD